MLTGKLRDGIAAEVGISAEQIDRACRYVKEAVESGRVPLAQVVVGRRGSIVGRGSWVHPSVATQGPAIRADTAYYLGFHREDVYMPLTPMFHVHAWGWPYMATALGVKQVYPGKYAPETLLKLIVQEGVTYSHCVPSILNMLLASPAAAALDLSRLKLTIGGAALPRSLALAALKRGVDVSTGYGLSESCPVPTLALLSSNDAARPLEEQLELRCRAGRPIGLVALRVIGENGDDTPRDDTTSGEVVVRAPWLTLGYLHDEPESEKLWKGGWMHTRDVGVRNAAGLLRITDRAKDVIKIGGEWLSSLALEDRIASHPSVGEVAVRILRGVRCPWRSSSAGTRMPVRRTSAPM